MCVSKAPTLSSEAQRASALLQGLYRRVVAVASSTGKIQVQRSVHETVVLSLL